MVKLNDAFEFRLAFCSFTRQVIISIILNLQFGCSKQMELKRLLLRQKPIDSMEMDFCANMYNEAALIAQENYPESRQDLFMEQGEQNTGTEFRDSNALIIN